MSTSWKYLLNTYNNYKDKFTSNPSNWRYAVQCAVYYYTNGKDGKKLISSSSNRRKEYFNALIYGGTIYPDKNVTLELHGAENATADDVNDITLVLYIPPKKTYNDTQMQPVISTYNFGWKNSENYDFTFTNTLKPVTISKVDVNGKEIAGAEIELKDSNGEIIDSWTSEEGKSHAVTVEPGEYTFHETAAPDGYRVVTDITFKVNNDGTIEVVEDTTTGTKTEVDGRKLIITDEYSITNRTDKYSINISKVDVNGKEIAGAEIELKDSDGTIIDSWTSEEGKSHAVTVKPGKYTFHETAAPDGYRVVTDITFKLDKKGKVTVVEDTTTGTKTEVDGRKLIITDEYLLNISKVDVNGKEIAGAEIELKDSNGTIIDSWTSDGSSHEIGVKPGTYTFTETSAPSGYAVVSEFEFKVDSEGKVTLVNSETTGAVVEEKNHLIVTDNYSNTPEKSKTTSNSSGTTKNSSGITNNSPGTTSNSSVTATSSTKTKKSINTGVSSHAGYMVMGLAAVLALVLADKKRRK